MENDAERLLAQGDEALAAGEWSAARDAFAAARELEERAEALDGLGEARWWLGETHEGVQLREQAYAGFRRRGDVARAVDVALWLSKNHAANFGNEAAAAGWLARARRLVDDHGLAALDPWVRLLEAEASDPIDGERLARGVNERARNEGDVDLQLCALSQIGAALIRQGRVPEGLANLDEAMAGALGGEGRHRDTVVFTSCTTMIACVTCAANESAVQWIRSTDRYARSYGSPFLYVECRTLYGTLLIDTGDWVQAEEELEAALESADHALPALHQQALAALARLRLAQGRVADAESLVAGLEDQPAAVEVTARIQLDRGRSAIAAARLRRHLAEVGQGDLASLPALELLGLAELDQDHPDAADEIGRHLATLGADLGCDIAQAAGARLRGQALHHLGATDEGIAWLETALAAFNRLTMPYQAGRTRLLIAQTLADRAPEVAVDEGRAALAAFDALGARRDGDAAAALVRDLGATASRPGPKGHAALTAREREVLDLVGEGRSNPQIADQLYISRRTVEQHVANILAKLGVANRTEAAARALSDQMADHRRR